MFKANKVATSTVRNTGRIIETGQTGRKTLRFK